MNGIEEEGLAVGGWERGGGGASKRPVLFVRN
jgi:hypothetical protein